MTRWLTVLNHEVTACTRCPRLVTYREQVAREKRRAYRECAYWGKPVPGFGDPDARLLILGLAPAAHGANRTGRVFTGDGAGGSGDFLIRNVHGADRRNGAVAVGRYGNVYAYHRGSSCVTATASTLP